MKKIDPRLDCIRLMQPEERLNVSRHVNYMAFMEEPIRDSIPEMRIQVFIQLKNPTEGVTLPGVKIRSRLDDIVTAQVTPDSLDKLEDHPNVIYVERGTPIIVSNNSVNTANITLG
jgi:hypothetical protein